MPIAAILLLLGLSALLAGVMVFPGGDHEVYRSTLQRNKIEFGGRTGYITTAIEAGVPIVPAVSVGAQETQLYLARGEWLSRLPSGVHSFARQSHASGDPSGDSSCAPRFCRSHSASRSG